MCTAGGGGDRFSEIIGGASLAGEPWPDSTTMEQRMPLTATLAGTKAVEVPTVPVKMPPREGMATPPGCSACQLLLTVPARGGRKFERVSRGTDSCQCVQGRGLNRRALLFRM